MNRRKREVKRVAAARADGSFCEIIHFRISGNDPNAIGFVWQTAVTFDVYQLPTREVVTIHNDRVAEVTDTGELLAIL